MDRSVLSELSGLRRRLAELDPAGMSAAACVEVVGELAATEKACAAARARVAAQAAASGAHRGCGFRDAADWLASVVGASPGQARADLDTAAALDACPRTRDALAVGDLSMAQAREITRAEVDRPGSEGELVAVAKRSTLTALRDEARRRRFAAVDADTLSARQHQARSVRHWRDDLGMVCGRFVLPPEVGVPFVHRLDAETDRVRRRARSAGSSEERAAHAADAFAGIVGDGADNEAGRGAVERRRRGRTVDLVIVCDRRAWARGHAHPGERCHIVDGTPIPVSSAKNLATDAFVKAVVHDGTRIDTVVHWGRHIPAEVRTALDIGPPPGFDGAVCAEPGCGRRDHLEWDHIDPVANRGPTSYANLAARCWPHHHDKTEHDRAAGLLGARSSRPPPR